MERNLSVRGNTTQNYTSIDANNVLQKNIIVGVGVQIIRISTNSVTLLACMKLSMRVLVCVQQLICVFSVSPCVGDVLQRHDPGQCHQTGTRTRRQQV